MSGEKMVKIFGEDIAVKAEIKYLDAFSGHADKAGLLSWIENMKNKPENIFLVHGEYASQQALKAAILDKFNINTVIPDFEETYTFDGKLIDANMPKYKSTRFDILEALSMLKQDIEEVSTSVKNEIKQTSEESELESIQSRLDELKRLIDNLKRK